MQTTIAESPSQAEIPLSRREFLSERQTAELLGVTEHTVKVWVREGHIPSAKIRGTRRIRRSDIDSLFE